MSLDVNHHQSNDMSVVSTDPFRSTVESSAISANGIENAVHNNNNMNYYKPSQPASDVMTLSLSSPLQPKQMNINNFTTNNEINDDQVNNKMSVSFAAEPTTLSSLLSDDDDDDDDDEEENNNNDQAPQQNSNRLSILDGTSDDDFGKPYRRTRRQRKSVGFYKWLATNSPNEYIDQNGNPRKMIDSSGALEDSMDSTNSSTTTEYDEEESEYVFDEDISQEEALEEPSATTHEDTSAPSTKENDSSMSANHQASSPSVPTMEAAPPTALDESQDPHVSAQVSGSPASPTTTTTTTTAILSLQVAKNQVVVVATPTLRRSPRKRRSIMPEEEEEDGGNTTGVVSVKPVPDMSTSLDPTSSPGRILSEQAEKKVQRVIITTPCRRSPRKKRCIQGGDVTIGAPIMPSIAEPPQSPLVSREFDDVSTERPSIAKAPPSPPSPPAMASIQDTKPYPVPKEQTLPANDILLSQPPVGNLQQVVSTPVRRSPRKKQSIQGDKVASTMMSTISEQAPSSQSAKEPSSPPRATTNGILKQPEGNLQQVVSTPVRRSPRKRQSIQEDKVASTMMSSIAEQPPLSQTVKEWSSPPPRATTNEILKQPVGNLQQVVSTPVRRSPRKRQSIQEDKIASTMMSTISEQAPLSQTVKEWSSPPRATANQATDTTKLEPNLEVSSSNRILSEQVEKNHQVVPTPVRRSPRKRQSLLGGNVNSASAFMASMEQAALSPIKKVSSPSAVSRTAKESKKKITMEMTTVTETLSNASIQSPLDQEMTTPVTQSPFPSSPSSPSPLKSADAKAGLVRRSPCKKMAVEVNEPESVMMSPFAAVELSPIRREKSSPMASAAAAAATTSFESPKSQIFSPLVTSSQKNANSTELNDSIESESEPASTSLLSQFSQKSEDGVEQEESSEKPESGTAFTMDTDEETVPQNGGSANSMNTEKDIDDTKGELEGTEKSFVLEYSLNHGEEAPALDESIISQSNCLKVRIVFDQSSPAPPKGILRSKLRYTKSDGEQTMEAEADTTVVWKDDEQNDGLDDTSTHGISLPELKHRMAILFPADYSQLIQSSCDAARLFACFTLYKDAQFVQNESMVQPDPQPTKTAARARTRRRRLSLECKSPGINYVQPIMPLLKELVQLELVQYQSMAMAKQVKGASSSSNSSGAKEGSHRVHFPAFDGSSLQPPSDVIEGSDRVREESIEQLSKVVMACRSLFGQLPNVLGDGQSETDTKLYSHLMAVQVLQNLVQFLQIDFVTHGHSVPCSMSFPCKSHLGSRVEKAALSYAHDLSHILRSTSHRDTPECLTFAHSSQDVSIVNRIQQSRRCGPWECRLADNAGQQIRYWLRTLLNPIPDRAPPKSAGNGTKAKQWRCRICDIVALCVEDAEQSMAVEDGSMSSLVSDALSFLYALFGVSTWHEFVSATESGDPAETGETQAQKRRQVPDAFFSSNISLRQHPIYPHQWSSLEEEMTAATEFLAAMNGVRFLYELFSILVNEPKYHKVWKKTIQDFAGTLALVDEECIQLEDIQLLLLRTPLEEILTVLKKISLQHSSKYIHCQKQLKEFSKRFAFGKKSKRKKRHQPHLGYLETAYEETMEKINFPSAMRL